MKRDAHVHTPFCPHGSTDSLHTYIERAIELGIEDITFTEHAPLPFSFVDTTPTGDSGMSLSQLESYLSATQDLKLEYQHQLRIRIGLEVDYIEGYEKQTTQFLNQYGPHLDDSILSVHFLQLPTHDYVCIDYSKELYLNTVKRLGGADQLYSLYYATVLKSISTSLGDWKPNRIGHFSLVRKFQHALSDQPDDSHHLLQVLNAIETAKMEIDLNSAGMAKEFCKEPYPPLFMAREAQRRNIPLVFGSDAHVVRDLHQFSEYFNEFRK